MFVNTIKNQDHLPRLVIMERNDYAVVVDYIL
jgi:hypothetical protein